VKRTLAIVAIGVDLAISLVAMAAAIASQSWVIVPGAAARLAVLTLLVYFALRKDRPWAAIVIVTLEVMTVTACGIVFAIPNDGGFSAANFLVAASIGVVYGGIGTAVGFGLSPVRRMFESPGRMPA
jgi:hypothetical protein